MKRFLILLITTILPFTAFAETPQSADISLSGVILRNPASSVKVLGKDIKVTEDESGPNYSVYNRNKTEVARFVMHEGDNLNTFSEIKVKYADSKKKKDLPSLNSVTNFVTGKKIKLGMSKEELFKILGSKHKTNKEEKTTIVKYMISDFQNSDFLQENNMPLYYGEYKFKKDKLIEFSFGFESP